MMRKWTLWIGLVLMVGIMYFPSCVHDPVYTLDDSMDPSDTTDVDTMNTDTTIVEDPCDPDKIYFERDILPLFKTNCAFSGCHNEATAQDGVILTSYDNVMNSGEVEPFNLDESDLYEVLTDDDEDDRMPPPPAERLSQDEIERIASWILQGAKDETCDYDNSCETDNIRFSVEIQMVLESGCISCHNVSSASGGVRLDTYDEVVKVAESGRLLGAIRWEPAYINMPFGGAKLNDCAIEQMELWIADGMPNN
ncbi:MAG: hypothetical protein GVX96_05295 [Bacteroidetes bacterium]|jgi:hypothetical protein|nr:hypothetical protein [Bacteroidota bacterium]